MQMTRNMIWTVAAAIIGTLVALALVILILIYSGAFNVSAAAGHMAVERWAIETMMRNSVKAHADAAAPERFTPAMIQAGAGEYKAMCQHCHGGPGVKRGEWAEGMVPHPPSLTRAAREWEPGEIHWIVKNGIKMTAMPAFGPTHDDRTIWNITAFVESLPTMTAEEYANFPSGHGEAEASEGSDSHTH